MKHECPCCDPITFQRCFGVILGGSSPVPCPNLRGECTEHDTEGRRIPGVPSATPKQNPIRQTLGIK